MRLLITAGPTREPIDDVRFISNRSSGRMGTALAHAAADAGHDTTLLLGPAPVHSSLAQRVRLIRFETCADLEALLDAHFPACDVLVMAAAVADYRPTQRAPGKLARGDAADLTLRLEPTPDLVAHVAAGKRADQRVVAFALEDPAQLEARAAAKMRRKGVDAIVANPLGTMEADDIAPLLLTADGRRLAPPAGPGPAGTNAPQTPQSLSKPGFAQWLVSRLTDL